MNEVDILIKMSELVMADQCVRLETFILKGSINDSELLGSLLTLAAQEGKINSAKTLIKMGANVNFQNHDLETPFSFASGSNQLECAKLLYESGANINSELISGLTPLDCAVCHSSPKFREWLRGLGGKRNCNYDEWPWPSNES